MKKVFLLLICSIQIFCNAQNVGIGTPNPTRAKLEVHGAVDATAAIFGGESSGISLQRNWPGIGFNQYYNGGSKYIGTGYAAVQFVDPGSGYMAIDMFGYGSPNTAASTIHRAMVISSLGRVNIGSASLPNANLNVARGSLSPHYATAAFEGSQHHSFFNYEGGENTYIRAGKDNGIVFINDITGGKVVLSGPVGINTATPGSSLEIRQANNTGLLLVDPGTFKTCEFRVYGTGGYLGLFFNGSLKGVFSSSSGEYTAVSDQRLKANVESLGPSLQKVLQLHPVAYELKTNNPSRHRSIGFLAQEVKPIFPELISVLPDTTAGYKDIQDVHTLNYGGLGVLAIKAIQEQQQLIESLEEKLAVLQQTVFEIRKEKRDWGLLQLCIK